jgi:hypothetical protein
MIQASGVNDVLRIYFTTTRDHVDYNLAFIGPDFTLKPKENFDRDYMRALYDYAHANAKAGYPWVKRPPFILAGESAVIALPAGSNK